MRDLIYRIKTNPEYGIKHNLIRRSMYIARGFLQVVDGLITSFSFGTLSTAFDIAMTLNIAERDLKRSKEIRTNEINA